MEKCMYKIKRKKNLENFEAMSVLFGYGLLLKIFVADARNPRYPFLRLNLNMRANVIKKF